ncbi:MFS transporter [Gracilimonas sp. BCB1]|uniref:MFS transporter n=1 Tax=Gracilimonas sp. BCB1 TaxID=3152362 RepID=UPI0032D8EA45
MKFISSAGSDKPGVTPKQQLIATCAAFFILGVVFATWASRIPAIRDASMLTPVTLGYALLGRGMGTILIMPAVTGLIHRVGPKKASMFFGVLLILSLIPMAVAPDWTILTVVLFVTGAGASGYNISINALGSKIEASTGRSHMSKIHSWFGVGNVAGALAGTAMASQEFSVSLHFWGTATLLLVILMGLYRYLPEGGKDPKALKAGFKLPHGGLLWLGVICFVAASIEDSIMNWVTLFFTDYVGTTEGLAPIGYSAYAVSMLIMRLAGDRLKPRFGAKALITSGSVIAASGVLISILSPNLIVASVGFVMAGAGVALTFPMIFSAAGKEGAVALATVATMGALGGMVSQPVMGYLVDNFTLTGGFIFICICMLAVGGGSQKARLLKK